MKEVLKWIALSILMAVPIGIIVGLYNLILKFANDYRKEHEYLIYLLTIAGLLITFMYLHTKRNAYSGENLLKSEVQSAAKDIPFYMTFVVFLGSLLTTFCGGSAGKEGSAVAMGGTLGDFLAKKLKLSDEEQRTLIICGVGSAFGVIYDVPFAGAILGGGITIILFLIVGDDYNGLGQSFINNAFKSEVSIMDSLWKLLFTAVALGSVFQGGRGNPTFFVGASLGSALSGIFNIPLEACAALGMIGVFCSATSLPITAMAMSVEYFGGAEMVAIIIVMTISYIISGFYDIFTKNKLSKGKEKIFNAKISEKNI